MKKVILFVTIFLFPIFSFGAMTITTNSATRTANADTTTAVCSSATSVRSIANTCLNSNTQGCVIGDSNISHASLIGIYLAAGATVTIEGEPGNGFRKHIDCNTINFEVGVNGEGVSYTFLN